MATNPFYQATGNPAAQTRGTSTTIRSESLLVQAGFDGVNTAISAKGAVAGQAWTGMQDFSGAAEVKVPTPVFSSDAVTKGYADAIPFGGVSPLPIAAAGGLVDAITAFFTPAIALVDQQRCMVVCAGANATATPTFSPNGLPAEIITMNGGQPLSAGSIPGAGFVAILEYNLANTRWEFLNPKVFIPVLSIFGDGSDGNVTINSAVTLTRDMFYNNLTLNGSAAINTAGYRIFVAGTLNIASAGAGAIYWNGNNGVAAVNGNGGVGGVALATTNLGGSGGGGVGGAGGPSAGSIGNAGGVANNGGASAVAGAGGAGSVGIGGASGPVPTTIFKGISFCNSPIGAAITGSSINLPTGGTGGSGGGGGGGNGSNSGGGGGGGGSGGGVIVIVANIIARGSNTNSAIIQSKGGSGAAGAINTAGGTVLGGGGGGSGGGGGWVYIIFSSETGSLITSAIDVSGGFGGNGGAGFTTGSIGGSGGGSGGTGTVYIYNILTSFFAVTPSGVGNAGSVASTITGAGGASANIKQVSL